MLLCNACRLCLVVVVLVGSSWHLNKLRLWSFSCSGLRAIDNMTTIILYIIDNCLLCVWSFKIRRAADLTDVLEKICSNYGPVDIHGLFTFNK